MDTWVEDIFRGFFAMLDTVVYWFAELLVTLFDSLAKIQLFSNEVMEPFANRLFAILSIAMIFKVSFSIIQFIINPSAFSDSEKGMGKIIQNVVLVLVCLVGIKYVFILAYNLQNDIITSNIIPQLVLGKGEAEGNYITAEKQAEYKRQIPFTVASVFVTPNTAIDGIDYDPNSGYYVNVGGNKTNLYDKSNGTSAFGEKLDGISLQQDYYFAATATGDSKPRYHGAGTAFAQAHATNDYALLFKITNAKHSGKSEVYLFEYKFLISTAAGVFLVIMYVNFCIDLTIRVVKLGFLQLISPIPIVSMIDPKSSKNGIMSKWAKNYMSTYLGLFIRVAAVNFVIFTIDAIVNNSEISGHALFDFITVVTIFGALMFAKEVPKLISDLTGVDLKGNFQINPIKRFEDTAIGGKNITGAVAGLASRGIPGMIAGFAGGKGLSETWRTQNQRKASNMAHRRAMEVARQNGSTLGGRMAERIHNYTGLGHSELQRIEDEEHRLSLKEDGFAREEAAIAAQEASMADAEAETRSEIESRNKVSDVVSKMEDRAKDRIVNGLAGDLSDKYLQGQNKAEQIKAQSDLYAQQVAQAKRNVEDLRHQSLMHPSSQNISNRLQAAESSLQNVTNLAAQSSAEYSAQVRENQTNLETYMREFIDDKDGKYNDKVVGNLLSDYNSLVDTYGFDKKTTAQERHDQSGEFKGKIADANRKFFENDKIRAENADKKRKIAEDKRELSEQKRQLADRKSAAQANANAVNRNK